MNTPNSSSDKNQPKTPPKPRSMMEMANNISIMRIEEQIKKQEVKLAESMLFPTEQESEFKQSVENIARNFEQAVKTFQDSITVEFLKKANLLEKLGKDLPQEDIDKIYYVHCAQDVKDTPGKRKNKVVKVIETLGSDSKEYKLALEYRVAKYKIELTNFFKSYASNNIRKTAELNTHKVSQSVTAVRSDLDNSTTYKAEIEKVEMLRARRASEKLRKDRAREKAKALEAAAKAGVIAVLDDSVSQTRKDLIDQFDRAVRHTQAELEIMKQQNADFNPYNNVEDYKELVANVMLLLETNKEEDSQPTQENTSEPSFAMTPDIQKAMMAAFAATQSNQIAGVA